MKIPIQKWWPWQVFVPRFDALSLSLMSLSFCLVCLLNSEFRAVTFRFLITDFDWRLFSVYALIVLFFSGMVLSFYHALFKVRLPPGRRECMVYFAVLTNGFSGIVGGAYILQSTSGMLAVFPVWNIVCSALLLMTYGIGVVNEDMVIDEAPSLAEVSVGALAVGVTFAVCQYGFDLDWAITFAICMTYATSLSQLAGRFLPERRSEKEIGDEQQ